MIGWSRKGGETHEQTWAYGFLHRRDSKPRRETPLAASQQAAGQHTCGHEVLSPPVLLVRPTCGRVPGNAAPAMCPLKSCSHSYYYLLKIIILNYLLFALVAIGRIRVRRCLCLFTEHAPGSQLDRATGVQFCVARHQARSKFLVVPF